MNERDFIKKNENTIEDLINLVKDVEDPEVAKRLIGEENYERVLQFLKQEREEEYARELERQRDEKKRLDTLREDREELGKPYRGRSENE